MTVMTFTNHTRSFKDFTYIYPVLSRRSQGISLGINLNVNNACNWRCIYCQVDDLVRGTPTDINLAKLEYELDYMLEWILHGDFMANNAPVGLQRLNDICLAGNGESTLSKQFLQVVEIIAKLRAKYNLTQAVKTILITNGSEVSHPDIMAGIKIINDNNGEVWFKIDRATGEGIKSVNQVSLPIEGTIARFKVSAGLCRTYVQTCMFKINGEDPSAVEVEAYLELLEQIKSSIYAVLLYTPSRNRAIPEGKVVSLVSDDFMYALAQKINNLGIKSLVYL